MLHFNIELKLVIASNTKRQRNVVLKFGQNNRQWHSIKPTKKSESRNLKFQLISHDKNNPTIFKMVAKKNAQNIVQTLLLLEKSQFPSSYIWAMTKYIVFFLSYYSVQVFCDAISPWVFIQSTWNFNTIFLE